MKKKKDSMSMNVPFIWIKLYEKTEIKCFKKKTKKKNKKKKMVIRFYSKMEKK